MADKTIKLPSGKTPATKVEGHEIQKPRVLGEQLDREVTVRNEEAIREAPEEPEEKAKEKK